MEPLKSRKIRIHVSDELGSVSGLLLLPANAISFMVLSHGAGAGMEHPFMETLAQELAKHQIATLRFNFLYMEKAKGPPDRPWKAHHVINAAIREAKVYNNDAILIAGGKSYGGRMMSQMASNGELEEINGLVYFGFPLHPPGKPGTDRASHLSTILVRQLFLQGTRDKLAQLDLIKSVSESIEKSDLVILEGGDHSFKTLKRSGMSEQQMMARLGIETLKFIQSL